jgi:hypothetical protein
MAGKASFPACKALYIPADAVDTRTLVEVFVERAQTRVDGLRRAIDEQVRGR